MRAALGVVLLFLCAMPVRAQQRERVSDLSGQVTLDLQNVTIREALKAVASQSHVSLIYSSSTVPLEQRVSLRVGGVSAEAALRAALRGTDVEVRESASGQLMLVRRVERPERSVRENAPALGMLSGHVTDSASGAPVIKATVTTDGRSRRTTTNEAGQYSLADVPAGAHVLTVRRIGYAPAEQLVVVPDQGVATVDFVLSPVASRLDEVVTTMTGVQKRAEVGNVIGTIDVASIVGQAPVTSFGDLINARVPGMQVVLSGGFTGSSPRVRIRGVNSLTVANDPLLVVDGVRVESSTSDFGGYGQTSGRLNDLNPEEVESIEIVKGPSAATLYGTDAANGVIVVKTKRGRAGQTVWNAHLEAGRIDQHAVFLDNFYSWGRNAQTGASQQCLLTQAAAGLCTIDSLTTFNPLINSATTPLGTGARAQYGIQASGGGGQLTYFVAGEFESEHGPLRMPDGEQLRLRRERATTVIPEEQLRPNALRRISLRNNTDMKVGSSGNVALSLGLTSIDVRIPSTGIFFSGMSGKGYRDGNDGWYGNRPGEIFGLRSGEHVTRYTGSLRGTWRPFAWLSASATAGTDFSNTFLDALQRRGEGPFGAVRNGRRQNTRTDAQLYTADLGASAVFIPHPRVSSRTSFGAQYNKRQNSGTTATGTNLSLGAETVTGAAVTIGAERNAQSVVAGTYVEELVGLDNRLYLTGALRADGAASFGRDFRTAVYPKASASWLVTEQRPGMLNNLRLRVAYGASGVQPGSTDALALVGVFPVLVDGSAASGGALTSLGNPDLKPERQIELEGGADIELLAQRLRLEATFYDRISHDALINRPLPTSLGIPSRQENIGSVRNRGLEWLIAGRALDNRTMAWDLSVNASINWNRLERIGAAVPYIGTNSYRNQEGYPLFSNWARPILSFEDANGNGIIEEREIRVGDTAVYLGPPLPRHQVTVASTVSLFDRARIGLQLDYRGNYMVINTNEYGRCGILRNCAAVNDPSSSLESQAAAVAASSASMGFTTFGYVQDASFIRWRELSLAVDLPFRLAHAIGATRGSLVLSGRNLRLFTSYRGVDPEKGSSLNFTEGYSDNPAQPPTRSWILRANLGF